MDAMTLIVFLVIACPLFSIGYGLGRQGYRRDPEDWQAKDAFPAGWKVGYVGISPDGQIIQWCGDDKAVAWITKTALNEREVCKLSKVQR